MTSGGNLPRVKVSNQAAMKRIIYTSGPITRLEIAKMLDLSLPTITTNISTLLKDGMIMELKEEAISSLGRKSIPVAINPSSRYFIGLEMRSTASYACVTDFKGNVLKTVKKSYVLTRLYEEVISSGAELVSTLLSWARENKISISGIGVCSPGIISTEQGVLKTLLQYDWLDKDIRSDLSKLTSFDGAIIVENDGSARGVAESLFNKCLKNDERFYAYLFVADGISCHLLESERHMPIISVGPGEIGYMVMEPSMPYNEIGSTGMLSELSGERRVKEKCVEVAKAGRAHYLKSVIEKEGYELPFSALLEAQNRGDVGVDEILREASRYLGIALANFDNAVRPDKFLVEAKLFNNEVNKEIFLESAGRNTFRHPNDKIDFTFISPDEFNGARGAAGVAVQQHLDVYVE